MSILNTLQIYLLLIVLQSRLERFYESWEYLVKYKSEYGETNTDCKMIVQGQFSNLQDKSSVPRFGLVHLDF